MKSLPLTIVTVLPSVPCAKVVSAEIVAKDAPLTDKHHTYARALPGRVVTVFPKPVGRDGTGGGVDVRTSRIANPAFPIKTDFLAGYAKKFAA